MQSVQRNASGNRSRFLCALLVFTAALPAWTAPADPMAQARAVYAEINQSVQRMTPLRFLARVPGVEYASEVLALLDQGRVRKLSVTDPDDSGNVLTDLYFANDDSLVFALRTIQGYTSGGQIQTRNEHRLYFQQDRLVHMLAGLAKTPLSLGDPLAKNEASATIAMATTFRKAALSPPPPTVAVGRFRKIVQGTVTSVESGDIACDLELTDTAGRVYREKADFALCENPETLIRQTVALTYSVGTVMAAACQGHTSCTKNDTVALVTRAVPTSAVIGTVAQPAATRGSWCVSGETEVFTCHPGSKRVSVCASKGATAHQGQLQYRFGPAAGGQADMVLPATTIAPSRSATGEATGFAGGGGAWLRFSHGNHAYVVYSGIGRWGRKGATEERHGVQVERNGKVLATLMCRNTDVNELSLEWFARMGIAPDTHGFGFPDSGN